MTVHTRPGPPDFYDSAFALPDIVSRMPPRLPREPSSASLSVDDVSVAVAVASPGLHAQIDDALGRTNIDEIRRADSIEAAALVIVQIQTHDASGQLAALRRRVRPDAAIITVLGEPSAAAICEAHGAGAFACFRPPLVMEEILAQIRAALDSRRAQNEVADLRRRLDLESHLASIGRMSAGLAHEIGTPLQVALTNMAVLKEEWPAIRDAAVGRADVETIAPCIDDSLAALQNLRAVLETMRGLMNRERTLQEERLDLREIVTDTRKLLVHELEDVEVEIVEEAVYALADRTLLGQIVRNLTANAAHAAKSLSSPRVRLHVYYAAGHAVISVRDNGPGIAPDMQERIFEPFFTTRRGRGGTGLGLALCREYALEMGATLSLWSMPGRGACFRLELPTS